MPPRLANPSTDCADYADYGECVDDSVFSILRVPFGVPVNGGHARDSRQAQAAILRLESIAEDIRVEQAKGQKARTWLSRSQVERLVAICGDDSVGQRDRVVLGLLVGAGLFDDVCGRCAPQAIHIRGVQYVERLALAR